VSSCAASASETSSSMVSEGISPAAQNTHAPTTKPPSGTAARRIGMSDMAVLAPSRQLNCSGDDCRPRYAERAARCPGARRRGRSAVPRRAEVLAAALDLVAEVGAPDRGGAERQPGRRLRAAQGVAAGGGAGRPAWAAARPAGGQPARYRAVPADDRAARPGQRQSDGCRVGGGQRPRRAAPAVDLELVPSCHLSG
jgi:hypothetical protein